MWYYKKNPKVYDLRFIVRCIYFLFFFSLFFILFFQIQASLDVFSVSHESEAWKRLGSVCWGTLPYKRDAQGKRCPTTAS